MPTVYKFYVYMMTSSSRRPLYTGVAHDLVKRVWQHKTGELDGYTKQYNVTRLVDYETFHYVNNAIDREKKIKGWTRKKKNVLIEKMNPGWKDLSAGWYGTQGPSAARAASG